MSRRRLLLWAINLQPGDVFASCTGWNHEVKSIKVIKLPLFGRWNSKKDKCKQLGGWQVDEVEITDIDDRLHYCGSSGGCVYYPETSATITEFWRDWFTWSENSEDHYLKNIHQRLIDNQPITDDRGLMLPEIKKLYLNKI